MLEENLVLDDFIQSMLICNQGYRVEYEPLAVATELPSPTLKHELPAPDLRDRHRADARRLPAARERA